MTVEQKAAVAVACLWAIVIAIALTCERRIARRELQRAIARKHRNNRRDLRRSLGRK